jgi:hypothetical protein
VTASGFCEHHGVVAGERGEEAVPQGVYPRRVIPRDETPLEGETVRTRNGHAHGAAISPSEIRPRLAQATAESVGEIQEALRAISLGATKEAWTTVVCPDCGRKHRAPVRVADTRAQIAALELWLRESLGRVPQTEEVPTPRLPANVAALGRMSWEEMQFVFASTYMDELAAAQRDGGETLLRGKLAALSEGERRNVREALD